MSLVASTTAGAQEAYKKAQASNSFAALPTGNYEVTVAKAEVIPFAKQGAYAKMQALNVQLRVVEDAKVGAKRVFFFRVPLFDKFLPTQKNPQGAPVFTYFGFFGAVGATDEQLETGKLPALKDILGKRLVAKINLFVVGSEGQEYHTNKDTGENEAWNEVSSVWASTAPAATGGRAVAGDPWASAAPAAAAPAVAQPPTAVDPWASAVPVVASDPAPALVRDQPWQPDAEDVAFASVAANGKKF